MKFLAMVRRIADRVGVLRSGRIVETGSAAELFAAPADPRPRDLLAAVPGRAGQGGHRR